MENVTLSIRPAKPADIPAMQQILEIAFADYYRVLNVKIPALTESVEDIQADLESKHVLVVTANQFMIAGTLRYEIIGNVCYISRFGVLPKWQSVGTGGMLLKAVEADCLKNGVGAIALHTASKLFKQVRYYYGQGFYIHSTDESRGYIRGLLIKELGGDCDLALVVAAKG